MFSKPRLYIRITRDRITAKDMKSGAEFSEEAVVAVIHTATGRQMLAIGTDAPNVPTMEEKELVYPFRHPRVMVDDVECALLLMQFTLKSMAEKMTVFRPDVVLHWTDTAQGGITPIEARAFYEIAQAAGANKVYISDEDCTYSDDEVRNMDVAYLYK